MKFVKEVLVIFIFTFIGEVLNGIIPLPIPAGVYGIVLLFAALVLGIVKLDQIENAGGFLLETMVIMFVPILVSIMTAWDVLKPVVIHYLLVIAVTTVLTIGVTGKVSDLVLAKSSPESKGGSANPGEEAEL